MCDESRPHGVGLTKSFGRRIVRNSSSLTIVHKDDITIGNINYSFYIQDSAVQPGGPQISGKSAALSSLITVESDGDAVTYMYDANEDRFNVVNGDSDIVGNVTLSKVSGGFVFNDGAVIVPSGIFASGSIKAVLKNPNGQNVGETAISVSN
ncbi:hypothetical protein [Brevibacillus reuszeri]|uniref:hypothetical protein n=1 Tax=Brevibacillus reuszeri TaxID=54915 RepID=UPI001F15B6AE|nr:hypothetical protein [Brevibacillus reuszeri]